MLRLSRFRLNIPQRLMLLVVIPILGLIAIGQMSFRTLYSEYQALRRDAANLDDFHVEVSEFLQFANMLSAERDASLQAFAKRDEATLEAFRSAARQLDAAVVGLNHKLDRLVASRHGTLFADRAKEIRSFFAAQLPDARSKTEQGSARPGDVFTIYTKLAYNALYVSECYRRTMETPEARDVFDAIIALEKMLLQESFVLNLVVNGTRNGSLTREELASLRRQYFISTENEAYLLKFQPELRNFFKTKIRKSKDDLALYQYMADIAGFQQEGAAMPALVLENGTLADLVSSHFAVYPRVFEHGFDEGKLRLLDLAGQRRRRAFAVGGFMLAGLVVSVLLTLGITRSTRQSLAEVTQNVDGASDDVRSAATQLASASQHISNDASQYAAAIEEISSNLNQVTHVAEDNKAHVAHAATAATEAKTSVDLGLGTIGELDTAINSARNSGQRINQVIARINELSFQTNLLALNAAIEAARAGEAGAGFAVVADEVRRLASRCADAAKETAELIGDSANDTATAISKSDELAQRFKELSGGIHKVNQTVGLISTNFLQQAASIAEINQSVAHQREIAQSMVAASEETASTAVSMEGQVEMLNASVKRMEQLLGRASRSAG